MKQKRLDDFSIKKNTSPINYIEKNQLRIKNKEKKTEEFNHLSIKNPKSSYPVSTSYNRKKFNPPTIKNLPPSYIVSASYNGQSGKVVIKLYDPTSEKIYFWEDNTGHKPYCLTNLSPFELQKIKRLTQHSGFDKALSCTKLNPLTDKEIRVTKILAKDPLAIGGHPQRSIRDIIPEDFPKVSDIPISPEKIKVWESRIRYYQSYIYDRQLSIGMIYEIINNQLQQKKIREVEDRLRKIGEIFKRETKEEQEYIEQWARLLEYPAPNFRRVALDIEVYSPIPNRVPDPREAAYKVVCVALYGSDGVKKVLILKRQGVREGKERLAPEVEVNYFNSEKELIETIFDALWNYPFVITFNGDDFDLRYLINRAKRLGVTKEKPIELGRRICSLKYGIHIDLYKFFFNRSIQIYAFNNRYRDVTLNDVGTALIETEKIKFRNLGNLTYTELAKYCLRDTEITFKLTSFEDNLVMKLILILSRISGMAMEDVSRQGVSRWIRNFMYREHRKRNILIPNKEDIFEVKGETSTKAIIKGKKYKGAIVVDPIPGVHFNVAVMDFPSLYPSIIKVWNLGYQSILCVHPECRKNLIPGTTHWVCIKKKSIESLIIGSLRDLRVSWYKPKSKDEKIPLKVREWYKVIQNALKVILNASYGVFGAESFDLYCPPVAEATAAIGRYSINQILQKAKNLEIQVLYGDTDSVFLKNPSKNQIEELANWTESNLMMSLDVEKVYRYAVFSSRKKNYLGVLDDGSVDVKGLTGKKRHIPLIIKNTFEQMKKSLAHVKTPADFEIAKKEIVGITRNCYMRLKRREWESIEELTFNVVLGESLDHYVKITPQHVKAARMLKAMGREVRAGDRISFVKTRKDPHVKPLELASKSEIDVDKYVSHLRSTFDQVLNALNLDFNEIIGLTKLERFM